MMPRGVEESVMGFSSSGIRSLTFNPCHKQVSTSCPYIFSREAKRVQESTCAAEESTCTAEESTCTAEESTCTAEESTCTGGEHEQRRETGPQRVMMGT